MTGFKINQIPKIEKFQCPDCGVPFILRGKKLTQVKMNRKRYGYTGPFCSPKCASKYNYYKLNQSNIQLRLPFDGTYENLSR